LSLLLSLEREKTNKVWEHPYTSELKKSSMAEICPKCGLPTDICVCGTISKEQQRIRVYRETRKWRRPVTVIEGVDEKSFDLVQITQQLKTFCACGGTTKDRQIILQGDHRDSIVRMLAKLGFPAENIEVS